MAEQDLDWVIQALNHEASKQEQEQEEEAEEAPFNVGDRVVIINDRNDSHYFVGSAGEITIIESNPDPSVATVQVKLDLATRLGRKFWFYPSEIQKEPENVS